MLLDTIPDSAFDFTEAELDYIYSEINRLPQGSSVIDIVEWAMLSRVLPPELAYKSGPFDWAMVPHLIEPAMELSPSSPIRRVIVCKGVQIGATTGLIENFIGYTIENDPCGLMYAREEKDAAKMAMDLQVDTMLELSGLKEKVFNATDQKGGTGSKNTDRTLFKRFPGGFIYGIGVNNAKKMRSNPIRKLLRDEIDAWNQMTTGREKGDPMELTEKRTVTFKHTKKILDISTPLESATSRIYPALQKSDFRKRFVPCPYCGEMQELIWHDKTDGTGFVWDYQNKEKLILEPGSVRYQCRFCEKGKKLGITENYKARMMNAGEYRATNLEPSLYLTAGFFIPSWYSLLEPWEETVIDWLKTIDGRDKLEALRNFYNLRMALPFEDVETTPKPSMMRGKNRNYLPMTVPNEMAIRDGHGPILVLTCAVDVHKNIKDDQGRLDVEVLGHCRDGATYSILWTRLKGDTAPYWLKQHSAAYNINEELLKENTWHRLEQEIIGMTYLDTEGKIAYPIRLTVVDSKYMPRMVQTFCKQYESGVMPIKGVDRYRNMSDTFKLKKGDHGDYYEVVVDVYKDRVAEYMGLKWKGEGEQKPGYMNYPSGSEYNDEYFNMYGGEHKINVYDERTGRPKGSYWKPKYSKAPNHAWDDRVYGLCALDILVWEVCRAGNIDGINYDYVFDALEAKIT